MLVSIHLWIICYWTCVKWNANFPDFESRLRVRHQSTTQCPRLACHFPSTKETLLETDVSNKATEMIDYCRYKYPFNTFELVEMSENTNRSAVKWYFRKGIFYRMLNKALRTNDLETLYVLSLFIRQLHSEIVELHRTQPIASELTLYRVQIMNNAGFEQLKSNRNGVLSWNAFIFASGNRENAEHFLRGSASSSKKKSRVLFVITVPALSDEEQFDLAKVNAESEDYLFSFTSIFRIGPMVKHEDGMSWIVHLTLTNIVSETPQWAKCTRSAKQILTKATYLCVLMSLVGDHEKAEQF